MEPRLINVNDLDRYTVVIEWHRYVPWVSLAEVPTAQETTNKLDRNVLGGCEFCQIELKEQGCCVCACNSFNISNRRHTPKFCPVCGRPLAEEAEAALKKREGEDNEID